MATQVFTYTGNDGDPLPSGFSFLQGSAFEIQNNSAVATSRPSGLAALAFYTAPSSDGVHTHSLSTGSSESSGFFFRGSGTSDAYIFAVLIATGELKIVTRIAGDHTTIAEGQFVPNFATNTPYEVEVQLDGEQITVLLEGNQVYSITESFGVDNVKCGLRLYDTGGSVNSSSFGDASELPATGNAPTITLTPTTETYTLGTGEGEPTITATASDIEDGDLTSSITTTGSFDDTQAGEQTKTWSVVDSDGNIASKSVTVTYVAKPQIIISGKRTDFTISQGQPFHIPTGYYSDPIDGYNKITPTVVGDISNIGTTIYQYNFTNSQGVSADQVDVTVTVLAKENITSTDWASTVQKYGEENITVNGWNLKRFDSPDGHTWAYGFEDETTVNASELALLTNDTTDSQICGKIKVPFDALGQAEKTLVSVEVTYDKPVDGSQIQVAFGNFRVQEWYRILKNSNGTNTIKMEFLMRPYHDTSFRITSNGTAALDPSRYSGNNGQFHDVGLGSDGDIVIYNKFGNDSGDAVITSINAFAVVGESIYNKDGHYLRGKSDHYLTPFRPDDPLNKGLPDNIVYSDIAMTGNKNNVNANHLSLTAGSDWAIVESVEGVRLGDLCAIGTNYNQAYEGFNTYQNRLTGSIASQKTKDTLGFARYVVEIDEQGSRIRMSEPSLTTYNSTDDGVNYAGRYYCLFTLSAEQAAFMVGDEDGSWSNSIVNYIYKSSNSAIDYSASIEVRELESLDELGEFGFNYLLPQNNFIAAFEGEDLDAEFGGERIINAQFDLPVGDYDSAYHTAWNSDRNYLFILPNKRYALHMYYMRSTDVDGRWICSRCTAHDLSQWSVSQTEWRPENTQGMTNSPRASGFSAAGGIVHKRELDRINYSGWDDASIEADLTTAETAINHALAGYLSACQMMANQYLTDYSDQGTRASYFIHRYYSKPLKVVNGGSGYSEGDVLYFYCDDVSDTHSPTTYAVQSVDSNGSIIKAFVTRNGQHKSDLSSATHAPTRTSGNGTGAIFDTTEMFTQSHGSGNVTSYPSGLADGGFANVYAGGVPMGAVFTIDPNLDLRAEFKRGILQDVAENGKSSNKWSYEFYALLTAIKKYGLIINDVATNTYAPIIFDNDLTITQRDRLNDNNNSSHANFRRLRALVVPVLNFTPTHHLKTSQDLKPTIDLNGGSDLQVANDWQDGGAETFSPLHGYETVYAINELDRNSTSPQVLSYVRTDASGNQSDIVQRTVTLDAPPAAALPTLSLTASPTSAQGGETVTVTATSNVTNVSFTSTATLSGTGLTRTFTAPSLTTASTVTVTAVATNADGVEVSESVSVNVAADIVVTAPVITLSPSNTSYTINKGDSFILPVATMTDYLGNETILTPSTNNLDTEAAGNYTVEWTGSANGLAATPVAIAITVDELLSSESFNALSRAVFEIDGSTSFARYAGRSNVETIRFKIKNTSTDIVDKNGYLDFDSNNIARVEVIINNDVAISSDTQDVQFKDEHLYVKFGSINGVGTPVVTIVIYVTGDSNGIVIAGPGMKSAPILRML
ncbi:hypothetical protein ACOI22_03305 [Glaciecola sp. 2405UD65-10]|uniref:hypothetical protein n=1 Tax=Glaciecola sp. 2405UD65-10 TaxID=3397244 RepID=UPI003B5A60A4